MKKDKKPQSRKENIVIQELAGEVLIYDLKRDKAFCLNKTSALVWQACDGRRTVAEINTWLGKQLRSQTPEDIVWLALDQLSKEDLIETDLNFKERFGGMSRREVIRKIGVSTAVALPVVAGLVAPPAYAQASGCGNMCTCQNFFPAVAGTICSAIPVLGGTPCPGTPPGCPFCYANNTYSSGFPNPQPAPVRAGTCRMS